MASSIPAQELLRLYRTMVTVRKFETLAGEMFAAGKIPGFIHLSIGQEASSVGVCSALRPDDYIITTHRGHGHVIAKGGDLLIFHWASSVQTAWSREDFRSLWGRDFRSSSVIRTRWPSASSVTALRTAARSTRR